MIDSKLLVTINQTYMDAMNGYSQMNCSVYCTHVGPLLDERNELLAKQSDPSKIKELEEKIKDLVVSMDIAKSLTPDAILVADNERLRKERQIMITRITELEAQLTNTKNNLEN